MNDPTFRAPTGGPITFEDLQRRYGFSIEEATLLMKDRDFVSYATSSASTSASSARLIQELNLVTEQIGLLAKKASR